MNAQAQKALELIRQNLAAAAASSGLTQQEIGDKMGLDPKDGRKAVSRLLSMKQAHDPRLSTLIKFAAAVEVSLSNLFDEKPPAKKSGV